MFPQLRQGQLKAFQIVIKPFCSVIIHSSFTISLWYHSVFHSLKVILEWKSKKCYSKLFYKFFASNLLKLLENLKQLKVLYIFLAWHPFLGLKSQENPKAVQWIKAEKQNILNLHFQRMFLTLMLTLRYVELLKSSSWCYCEPNFCILSLYFPGTGLFNIY